MEPSSAPWRVLEPSEPETPASPNASHAVPWPAIAAAVVAASVAIGAFLLASSAGPDVGVDGAAGLEGVVVDPGAVSGDPGAVGPPTLIVEVGGAVRRPGVYRLPAGSRIGDAITAAGGFAPMVDAAAADRQLNLAAPLHDGDEVHVPGRDEAASTDATGGATGGAGGLIDVNTATADQLDTLPGIGPATAARIIAAREEQRFASVDDLRSRKIVGEATLEKIRGLVTAGP